MSGSESEGRNPLVPRPTESSPSSCVPEDRADSELVQQRRARGWVEEPDGRQEAVGRCDHERHALARAGDEQPPAALAADGDAAGYRFERLVATHLLLVAASPLVDALRASPKPLALLNLTALVFFGFFCKHSSIISLRVCVKNLQMWVLCSPSRMDVSIIF